jgi:hypothetical protein
MDLFERNILGKKERNTEQVANEQENIERDQPA